MGFGSHTNSWDFSGRGGDAGPPPDRGHRNWHGGTGRITGGDGQGGNVTLGSGRDLPDVSIKTTGQGGKAWSNAGGVAKGGDGRGGDFKLL